jgi:hypothetical protein
MEKMFGGLLEFTNETEFNEFVNNMSKEDSLKLIEVALTYGQQNGLYSFEESHTLYKCLSKLKEK